MKVTITSTAPSQGGVRLGLRIEHEKAGWIRFCSTVLLINDLKMHEREWLVAALNHGADPDRFVEDLELPLDWSSTP